MSPGELVRQIVQNCYGPDDISLTPRPPGPPRPRQGEPDPEPQINPGQVIRDIVDRCYPVVPVPDITPDEFPGVDPIIDLDPVGPTDWLCDLFPELAICNIFPIGPLPFPDGDGPVPGGDDCKRVMAGLADETVAISPRPDEADEGIFYVLDTGEKLICKERVETLTTLVMMVIGISVLRMQLNVSSNHTSLVHGRHQVLIVIRSISEDRTARLVRFVSSIVQAHECLSMSTPVVQVLEMSCSHLSVMASMDLVHS